MAWMKGRSILEEIVNNAGTKYVNLSDDLTVLLLLPDQTEPAVRIGPGEHWTLMAKTPPHEHLFKCDCGEEHVKEEMDYYD